jgi:hypothetical protein
MLNENPYSESRNPALFGPDSGDTEPLNFEATSERPTSPPTPSERRERPLAFDLGLYGRDNGEGGGEVF